MNPILSDYVKIFAGPSIGTSAASIKAQVKHELQAERKQQEGARKLAEVYSAPKEVNLEGCALLAVSGVYFSCPLVTEKVLPKAEMEEQINVFLYSQLAEEPQMTSALMVYTLNKDAEKVKVCVETLCKYLDNMASHPGEEKYCKIRANNKAFQERVSSLEGTEAFLQAAGFSHKTLPGPNDTPEVFLVMDPDLASDSNHLASMKEILMTAEAIKPVLDRNRTVYISRQGNFATHMEVPREFYNISPEEIKKEQQAKTEAVERLGMLRTKEMRERERQRELRRYRYCLIRVRFPDGVLLQGTFRATEKLSVVTDYVRENLTLDWVPFSLTVQGGSQLKDDSLSLAELGLAPASLLHFAYDKNVLAEVTAQQGSLQVKDYLKVELLAHALHL